MQILAGPPKPEKKKEVKYNFLQHYNEEEIKTDPHFLVSVYINEDNEIETIECLEEFVGGDYGRELLNGSDEVDSYTLRSAGIFSLCTTPDTLYHIYGRVDCYACHTMEGTEYDSYLTLLTVIKIKENYSKFLADENDYLEQQRLSHDDYEVGSIDIEGDQNFGWTKSPNITFREMRDLVDVVAINNVRLAHRLSEFIEHGQLENKKWYSEEIWELEEKRMAFKSFLKYNSNVKVRYTQEGYQLENNSYWKLPKGPLNITFDMIENLSDEILSKCSNEEMLEYFYNTDRILKEFKGGEE